MPIDNEILSATQKDIKDGPFVDAAIRAWLHAIVPEYIVPDDFHVEIVTTKDGLAFLGRLDLDAINKLYHRRISPTHSSVTPSSLLSQFLNARKELSLAASLNTDLWVDDGLSSVIQQRVSTLIATQKKAKEDIAYFHNVTFEGRSFKEAINKGERSGADLIDLLQDEETRKFKAWLGAQPPEGHLIKEYDRAIFARHGWTQRLPFKLGKIGIFAGLGVAVDVGLGTMGLATAAVPALSAGSNIMVGATDEFVLSKILGGWKPNQFIEGPARRFLQSDPSKQA